MTMMMAGLAKSAKMIMILILIMLEVVMLIITMILFFFYSVLRPFQDYFSSCEMGQAVGGTKMGEPREKPPGTPASRTRAGHSGEMIK